MKNHCTLWEWELDSFLIWQCLIQDSLFGTERHGPKSEINVGVEKNIRTKCEYQALLTFELKAQLQWELWCLFCLFESEELYYWTIFKACIC